MKITIITATNNSEATIKRNLLSVIDQLYKNYEHIIVDNKSNDRTLEIAREVYNSKQQSEKLKIISEPDQGISDAFNKGIKASYGDVIAILNSDDYYQDNSVLQKAVDALSNSEIYFAHGDIFFHDPFYGSNIRRPLLCKIMEAMPYNHPTMFIRKKLFNEQGVFDNSYKTAMDYELILRFENSIPNFRNHGKYIKGDPLVVMEAGGESWNNEIKGLNEIKRALIKYGLWNFNARKAYLNRAFRTYLKKILSKLRLNKVVYIWRRRKWKN